MDIDPRMIVGPWQVGFTLALHTVSSEFLGYNEQGHEQYDTVRSDIGERLYCLKYRGDQSAIIPLAEVATGFIEAKSFPVEAIVPLPPTKRRAVQPVTAIAEAIAKRLNLAYDPKALRKIKETPELKSPTEVEARQAALKGAFVASREALGGKVVLLFDDLYRSGASMQEATEAILNAGAISVYALALTRTRRNR